MGGAANLHPHPNLNLHLNLNLFLPRNPPPIAALTVGLEEIFTNRRRCHPDRKRAGELLAGTDAFSPRPH
jgi:hypothetical protein